MSLRLTPSQAVAMGLAPAPAKTRRKPGEIEILPDGHVVNLAYVGWTEHDLDAKVMELAKRYGWWSASTDTGTIDGLAFHAASVVTASERGWPDRTLIRRRDRRLIFAELKSERGYPSPRQAAVLDLLRCLETGPLAGVDRFAGPSVRVFVWRPSDILEIETVLR